MKIKIGQYGENVAEIFLRRQGYKIFAKNFRTKLGEIDFVAQDGRTLCFIEVKTRQTSFSGTPWEAVTKSKQRKIARVALWYLKQQGREDCPMRFDVVAVDKHADGSERVEILKNAFDTSDLFY